MVGDAIGALRFNEHDAIARMLRNRYTVLVATYVGKQGSRCFGNRAKKLLLPRLTPDGTLKIVYSFGSAAEDGSDPDAGLVRVGSDLYGTTPAGGANNFGTVRLTPDGKETVLHSFTGKADGGGPNSVLIHLAGEPYGATANGGTPACVETLYCGVVYRITPQQQDRSGRKLAFSLEKEAKRLLDAAPDHARPATWALAKSAHAGRGSSGFMVAKTTAYVL